MPLEHHLTCAVYLLWGADFWLQPSWQMSTVQDPRKTLLTTGSLLKVWWWMPLPGTEIASCLPVLAVIHLSLCLRWRGEDCTQQLALIWYWLNPLFCERARLEPLTGKFSFCVFFFLSLSLWLYHSLSFYLTLAPSYCPQGIQAQSLP